MLIWDRSCLIPNRISVTWDRTLSREWSWLILDRMFVIMDRMLVIWDRMLLVLERTLVILDRTSVILDKISVMLELGFNELGLDVW